jgi:hypothetical protein
VVLLCSAKWCNFINVLSVVMLSVAMLSAVMLSVVMQSVACYIAVFCRCV